MIADNVPRLMKMRPIASIDDAFAAAAILAQASSDDLAAFRAVIPSGTTPNPVEIAEDGSAATFDVYAGTEWNARKSTAPIARVIVRQ
jgi:hypothetical protein